MNDSRFVIATHLLTILADGEAPVFKSCQMAGSVNTHPVVIRRVLGQLAKAGLVHSTPGAAGGSRLKRPAEQITLRDIYEAVGGGEIFSLHHRPPSQQCYVGANIQAVIEPVLAAASGCVGNELAKTTLAEIYTRVQAKRSQTCGVPRNNPLTVADSRGRNRSKP